MRIDIMTLFPDTVGDVLSESILGRAQERGILRIETHQIRDYTANRQNQVDDYPYGGGHGAVLQADPLYRCWCHVCDEAGAPVHTIYLSPAGHVFDQSDARRLAKMDNLVFVCGHYEGIDQRFIDECVDEELSIGDFVVTGGEIPAMAITDAVCRLVPGVLYTVVVTLQIFLVYFCFNMLYHGTNVGVPLWVATVLNLVLFQMLFAYMWPQVVLLDQPLSLTLKNSINCMIAFLPHALAAAIVQVLFWGVVILCMPLGLFLMLIFGFWFVTEVSCQIVYGDIDRVFHIEENIRKMKDAELEAALKEDYADDDTPEE